ncbi:MAG: putative phage abortive infection protein [Planctomycetes bacterium]|nr:putative phage abortive infection protein [Planctomycetota bacterium]
MIRILRIHIDAHRTDPKAHFYLGKQHMLSNYFRQFYQAVTYIDSTKDLSPDEKYAFIKNYRAQLTNHEQALLFYDSLSELGRAWELLPPNENLKQELITTYNLIKNLPPGFAHGIDIAKYYPKVEYEISQA